MEIIEIIKMLPKGTMLYADVANLRNVVLGGVLDGNRVLVMSKIRSQLKGRHGKIWNIYTKLIWKMQTESL